MVSNLLQQSKGDASVFAENGESPSAFLQMEMESAWAEMGENSHANSPNGNALNTTMTPNSWWWSEQSVPHARGFHDTNDRTIKYDDDISPFSMLEVFTGKESNGGRFPNLLENGKPTKVGPFYYF
jgi:hypothetical protein